MRTPLLALICLCGLPFSAWSQLDLNEPYHIKSIFFGGGSYYIDGGQAQELFDFLDQIPDIEQYEIIIQSHTDNIGSLESNQRLSRMRSEAAYRLLLKKPIAAESMVIMDFGETSPVYDNRTWEGKLANRRVDVIIRKIQL